MTFTPDGLYEQLLRLPACRVRWVAYSGGLDSHVLLHALAGLRNSLQCEIGAVHINHGLHGDAQHWEAHCRAVCAGLDIRFRSFEVDARPAAGESPEAASRAARYRVLADWLAEGDCLLTAQHQDDQAETLLLQLLRGAGVRGLAAMPAVTRLGTGYLHRPLLEFSRQELYEYASEQGLQWVEDPSNEDTGLDRNFLRRCAIPELRQRWPSLSVALSRSAAHCAEAADIMEELARHDAAAAVEGKGKTVLLEELGRLGPLRQRNVLRYWFRSVCANAPSAAVLTRVMNDVLHARPDAEPCVRWGGHELHRYRDRLYLLPRAAAHDSRQEWIWKPPEPLQLPQDGGVLTVSGGSGKGISAAAIRNATLRVRYRRGGERCRPAGRRHHHALKKLFQEQGIPPWQRFRIPLIYIGDELAAVAGLWVCEPFQTKPAEPGFQILWSGAAGLCD